MGDLMAALIVAGFAATLAGLAWLGRRLRRHGGGGEIMAPLDDIFHPAAHRARFEIQAFAERKVPMPAPGDPFGDALG